MDELEEMWQRLKLTTDEREEIHVKDDRLKKEIRKKDNFLVGRIHIDHTISKEVLMSIMHKV